DVSLLMINRGKCRDSVFIKKNNAVKVLPLPKSDFNMSTSSASKFESKIYFKDASNNASSVQYRPMPGVKLDGRDSFFQFPDTGRYKVMQISQNEFGCSDTSYQWVHIYDEFHCYFPNAFTPNGDGNNDFFKPVVSGIKQYDFQIYNRWGELIFTSKQAEIGWDGKRNGQPSQ